jgi:hypothetical protein
MTLHAQIGADFKSEKMHVDRCRRYTTVQKAGNQDDGFCQEHYIRSNLAAIRVFFPPKATMQETRRWWQPLSRARSSLSLLDSPNSYLMLSHSSAVSISCG